MLLCLDHQGFRSTLCAIFHDWNILLFVLPDESGFGCGIFVVRTGAVFGGERGNTAGCFVPTVN